MGFDLLYLASVFKESEREGTDEDVEFIYDWYLLEWIRMDPSNSIKNRKEEEECERRRESIYKTYCYKQTSDNETLTDSDNIFRFAIGKDFQ